ncbi:MAG: primosomal protein N' [Deltaproteobacteria bacterium]|nr:primosomal protein N' [Deltaproteobacteria bacterium]
MLFVEVALPIPKNRTFTYRLAPGQLSPIKAGSRVLVPFGRRKMVGIVLSFPSTTSISGIKEILEVLDPEPVFSERMLALLKEVSREVLSPIGEVLKVALPAVLGRPRFRIRTGPVSGSPSPKVFGTTVRYSLRPFVEGSPSPPVLNLNPHQKSALAKIDEARRSGERLFLLHGVTGSGKTEVYLQVIQKLLEEKKQVLLLTPEIGLTPQLVERVRDRFGNQCLLYHSGLSDGERLQTWQRVYHGEGSLVVGTRSAVFLPFSNLGLIVMDEEQDPSYKQEDRLRYHAREIARRRCQKEGAFLLLGSATPSLESFYQCTTGAHSYFFLPERATGASLPEIVISDMRKEEKTSIFSKSLLAALAENLYRHQQSLLFLNRRGFANFLVCHYCGEYFPCPRCHVSLTLHQKKRQLHCHYCDWRVEAPTQCPQCGGDRIRESGFGTEKVEEEVRTIFPEARVARLDRDTMTRKEAWPELLARLQRQEIDILIGTQMIAKGHDYPGITLVGVLNADTILNFPDFRASERTFHLLLQVAGRAGRGSDPGRVFIQTYHPDHPCFESLPAHNILEFYRKELMERQELNYPPFSRIVRLEWNGTDREKVEITAVTMAGLLKEKLPLAVTLLGPAPCPLEKLRNRYRWHLLAKVKKMGEFQKLLKELLDAGEGGILPSGLRLIVDIDPLNLL